MKYKFIFAYILLIIFLLNPIIYANSNENISNQTENTETSSNISSIPSINSRAAIVMDRNTKTVLYEKKENEKRKMASTTKIMTAIIVLENSNLNDIVEISKKSAGTGGSRLGLKISDKITVKDLLYGLLLCSGNDAAVALAEYVGGDLEGFAKLMNNKANSLKLENTHFVTPHGLDNDEHYTTAYELAILADYALENNTFKSIVSTKNYTITINGNPKNINNTNELLGNLSGVYGVKTGFTNGANRCLVTSAKRGNLDIICVVLGADTKKFRTQDSTKLIEYTFNNFEMVNIKEIIEREFESWKKSNISKFHIKKGIHNNANISLLQIPYESIPINKAYISTIKVNINCDFNLTAPVAKNQSLGTLNVIINNESVINLDILNNITIDKKDIKYYLLDIFRNYNSTLNFGSSLDNIV